MGRITPPQLSQARASGAFAPLLLPTKTVSGTTHTLDATDMGYVLECTNVAGCVITIEPDSTEAIDDNSVCEVYAAGAGEVSFAAGSGVSIESIGGALAISGQYGSATLRKRGTDQWALAGSLADPQ